MNNMIQAVPRADVERLYPHLKAQPLWGEEKSYTMEQCKELHYIVYGPLDPRALVEASRLFKSVKVLNKGDTL